AVDIAKMPDAPHGLAEGQINWGQVNIRRKDIPVKTDPTVQADLMERMFDPEKPTTELDLMKASVAGNLADQDFTKMRRLVHELQGMPKDPVFKAGLSAAKQQLEVNIPGLPGRHPEGAARYSSFIIDFNAAYSKAKKAGTLEPNATDASDPKSMISQFIRAHDVPAAQKLSEYMAAVKDMAVVQVPN